MISFYVAVSRNDVIGKENGLPWYLPSDLRRFKEITMGHPIVMGRKTHESIGRALPGRENIVITHDQKYKAEGCVVAHSLEEALDQAKNSEGGEEIFIIGGSTIYEQALPKTDKLYLTKVDANIDGDIFFHFNESEWKQTFSEHHPKDEKNQYDYDFVVLTRR